MLYQFELVLLNRKEKKKISTSMIQIPHVKNGFSSVIEMFERKVTIV